MDEIENKKKGLSTSSIIVVVVFLIAIALFVKMYKGSDYSFTRDSKMTRPIVDIADVSQENAPFIGESDAPVVLAYWADFQCPFCKQFEKRVLSEVIKNYVENGKVKVIFKDYAFLGPDSDTAAITGRAVWELYPEKYWEWREAMFTAQDEEHGGFGDMDSVMQLTATISGIDANKVDEAIKDNGAYYRVLIQADRTEGADSFGINGTPGSIVGNQLLSGLLPYASFKEVLDKQME